MDTSSMEQTIERRTKIIKMMMVQHAPAELSTMSQEALLGFDGLIKSIMTLWTVYENIQKIGSAFEEEEL